MRCVNFTGKHNIDRINAIDDKSYKAVRKHMSNLAETVLAQPYQVDIIRNIYVMGTDYAEPHAALFLSELNHKIQSYKGQDLRKEIHEPIISMEDVLAKLVASRLTCGYCSKPIFVLYKNARDPMQWTLDRLNNDLGHTCENTCIACLKCNLQRRVMDAEKFSFTKKLKIQKV